MWVGGGALSTYSRSRITSFFFIMLMRCCKQLTFVYINCSMVKLVLWSVVLQQFRETFHNVMWGLTVSRKQCVGVCGSCFWKKKMLTKHLFQFSQLRGREFITSVCLECSQHLARFCVSMWPNWQNNLAFLWKGGWAKGWISWDPAGRHQSGLPPAHPLQEPSSGRRLSLWPHSHRVTMWGMLST